MKKIKEGGDAGNLLDPSHPSSFSFSFFIPYGLGDADEGRVGAGSLLATSYPLCPKLFFFLLLSLGTRRTINRLYNSRHLDPSISS